MRYEPVNSLESPRFSGVRTFMRLPHARPDAGPADGPDGVDVAFVGLPFDTGSSFRVGSRFGPEAIRAGSALLRPYHPELDLPIFRWVGAVDWGDVAVVPGFTEESYQRIEAGLAPLVRRGAVPIGLGGDHSVTLAELRAVAAVHGPVGLLQVDAHPDSWDLHFGQRYTHGTFVRRAVEEGLVDPAASIQVGLRGSGYGPEDLDQSRELGIEVMTMREVRRLGLDEASRRMRARAGDRAVFLSFDIDSLDPAYAPGTGTPEIGGFTSGEAVTLLWTLAGVRLVGADVVEVLPAHDPAGITAVAAANLAYQLLALVAWRKRRPARAS